MEKSVISKYMTCFVEGMENFYDTLQQQQHQQESAMDGNMTCSAEGMEMEYVLSQQQHQHQHTDENEPSQTEDGSNDHHNKWEEDLVRQDDSDDHHNKMTGSNRLKWEDDMMRLLIQVICSVDEERNRTKVEDGEMCFRKRKWRCVSEIMLEKGFDISPYKCKCKFNDLYKKFKRLNDTLGGEDASKVVENPALLDSVDCISKKTKEEIRKILCSKQLFYEEMCSYHTANKLYEENGEDAAEDIARTAKMQSQRMRVRELSLNKRKVEIEAQALELEKEQFKWQKISSEKDRKLKMLELKIEKMKLENERMQMLLKQKELEIMSEAGVTSHDPLFQGSEHN